MSSFPSHCYSGFLLRLVLIWRPDSPQIPWIFSFFKRNNEAQYGDLRMRNLPLRRRPTTYSLTSRSSAGIVGIVAYLAAVVPDPPQLHGPTLALVVAREVIILENRLLLPQDAISFLVLFHIPSVIAWSKMVDFHQLKNRECFRVSPFPKSRSEFINSDICNLKTSVLIWIFFRSRQYFAFYH